MSAGQGAGEGQSPDGLASPQRWTVLRRIVVVETRIFRVVRLVSCRVGRETNTEDTTLPTDSHHPVDFVAIESADFVNIIALTPRDELILVEQYRHATGAVTLEIPGGLVDAGEGVVEAGLRELREETGYTATSARVLGVCRPNHAIMTNHLTTLLATNVELSTPQALDEHEDCVVHAIPFVEVMAMVDDGRIDHALVLAALTFELRRRATSGSKLIA
jgi:ADP-ribose pyrophosphatase